MDTVHGWQGTFADRRKSLDVRELVRDGYT
jgi:hypothetical protein